MSIEAAFERLRGANPVPDPAALREEPARPGVTDLLAAITERSLTMPTRQALPAPPTRRERRLRGALVAAASLGVVAIALGLVAFLDRGEAPAPPVVGTTDTPTGDPRARAAELADAVNRGDLDATLAIISPQSNCDLPIPGTGHETCEQYWANTIAIGTTIGFEDCTDGPPWFCFQTLRTEVHAIMGYPDYTLRDRLSLGVDPNGRLVYDLSSISPSKPYMPDNAANRLFAYMVERYPDLNVDPNFGPNPYDLESGLAMIEAARELNDPARIVDEIQSAFDASFAPTQVLSLSRCVFPDGTRTCSHLFGFLGAINADLDLDCDPAAAEGGFLTCPLTFTSDIHTVLGSQPAVTEATVEYRGGRVMVLELDLPFSADPAVHEAFLEHASNLPDLHDTQGRPLYAAETAPGWLAAARDFAGG